jgi:hypothetical protein
MEEETLREKRQKAVTRKTKTEELLQAIERSEVTIDSIAIGIGRNPVTAVSPIPEGILPSPNFDSNFIPLNSYQHEIIPLIRSY